MGQHPPPDPDPYRDEEEDLEALGTPVYDGSSLSVRALTAEELQQFLDAHHGQPARPLSTGWAALDPPGHPSGVPRTPPAADLEPPGSPPLAAAERAAGSRGRPGRSALAHYRRRRAAELAAWTRSLLWRAPLMVGVGLVAGALAAQAGLPRTLATLAGLTAATLLAWRLRFRPSEQTRAWQRGAHGEQQTARLLDRLGRDGYVVLHDLAMPDSPANIDHLVIGPSGLFVIDSKLWTGQVQQSADGLLWHNHSAWTAPWAPSAGKPSPLATCSASPSPPCSASMVLRSKGTGCAPRAWPSSPPSCSAPRLATSNCYPRST